MTERYKIRLGDESLELAIVDPQAQPVGSALLVPPFGMTARDMFWPAHCLAQNGFLVASVDGRNSLGEGSGDIADYRLSGIMEDLDLLLDHHNWDLLVAMSLSSRAVIRVLADRGGGPPTVLVAPVVHVAGTLNAVLERNYFAEPVDTLVDGIHVLGHFVRKGFILDCIRRDLVTVESTMADVKLASSPMRLVYGDSDPWVSTGDVEAVLACNTPCPLATGVSIHASYHELARNPVVALRYVREMVNQAVDLADPRRVIEIPRFADVLAARRQTSEADYATEITTAELPGLLAHRVQASELSYR